MNFIIGQFYSRRDIHKALGGELETYLPQRDGQIVCACLTEELGPDVPNTVLVGDAPRVIEKAKLLLTQTNPIPVFVKRRINKWQCVGEYRAKGFSAAPLVIQQAKKASGRDDIAMVLYLQDAQKVSQNYLQYWKGSTADYNIGKLLDHIASDQLKPSLINKGDRIWIVTSQDGRLFLLGRIIVGKVIEGQKDAERHWSRENLWDARFHIAPEPGTEEYARKVEITDIVFQLRFDSKTANRLEITGNRVNAQQLQRVRKLTAESVALLEVKWQGDASEGGDEYTRIFGAGFGDPKTNKKVEERAVAVVRESYEKEGWYVESVEAQKIGFDLLCRKDSVEEHVEVKGVQGNIPTFNITAGEVRRGKHDLNFVLYVVTSALSSKPYLQRFTSEEFLKRFDLAVLAYRATLTDDDS